MDSYTCLKERAPPQQVMNMMEDREMLMYKYVVAHFDSFYEMMRAMRVPKPVAAINVSWTILGRDAGSPRGPSTTDARPDPNP
jgi:hypothetical protein